MNGVKVAVIGSRSAGPEVLGMIIGALPVGCTEIISGGAEGADLWAKAAALELGLRYTCLRPKYRLYGRSAPLRRNAEIVSRADAVLAFWDGRSGGTRQAIACCISMRRPFRIYLLGRHDRRPIPTESTQELIP